jgi:hypothetical protein
VTNYDGAPGIDLVHQSSQNTGILFHNSGNRTHRPLTVGGNEAARLEQDVLTGNGSDFATIN